MSGTSSQVNGAATPGPRNPRRRARKDTESPASLRQQPQRKRNKLSREADAANAIRHDADATSAVVDDANKENHESGPVSTPMPLREKSRLMASRRTAKYDGSKDLVCNKY